MPIYRNKSKLVLFVHIPKTGGSTIEETLCHCGAMQALKYPSEFEYGLCSPQHLHSAIYDCIFPKKFWDYGFTVVRNPFTRLISEYMWQFRNFPTVTTNITPWVHELLAHANVDSYLHDNHVRPQYEFTRSVEVFRFEDGLDVAIQRALSALGLPMRSGPLRHLKQSRGTKLFVDAQTIERIISFYARDFSLFDYSTTALPEILSVI